MFWRLLSSVFDEAEVSGFIAQSDRKNVMRAYRWLEDLWAYFSHL